eukprot:TRINITY_DN1296_c0_g1_i3.p1 TRINITY_DN1296_c0_g1~~TRINITY_DN1296_c0_g1_i3.p1  ORF type:complete len:253 (+),score=35.46 TRINITY_DN1296_c0_g1_i3:60-761(+)
MQKVRDGADKTIFECMATRAASELAAVVSEQQGDGTDHLTPRVEEERQREDGGPMKKCPRCKHDWPKLKRKCDVCQEFFSSMQETMAVKRTSTQMERVKKPRERKKADLPWGETDERWSELFCDEMAKRCMMEPVFVNPSGQAALKEVLASFKGKALQNGRKWVLVYCDGVPYMQVYDIVLRNPGQYDWLVLRPGPLHEEMNMISSLVPLPMRAGWPSFAGSNPKLKWTRRCD